MLPPEGREVLVTVVGLNEAGEIEDRWVTTDFRIDGGWFTDLGSKYTRIVAWRELPAPEEGEE